MSLSKEQLVVALIEMGVQGALDLLQGIRRSLEWHEHWVQLLEAIEGRLYSAAATLELQDAPN